MAYIVRDTSAFIPGQPQVGGPQSPQDPQRAQRAAGWLQLANAAASSPLLGALLRGGQAIKHKVEDSQLKAAAERKVARERAALERSPTPLADTGGGFTLQDPEGETIFGKGALSKEPPAPSWIEPGPTGHDRWKIDLPEGGAPTPTTPPAEAPAAGPAPDVARGEMPGGPAEATPPAAVGIEPEIEPGGSRALVDAAWTPPERIVWPAALRAAAARRVSPPIATASPPPPAIVGGGPTPVAAPTEPAPNFYPETPEEASWKADVAKIHGMLAPEPDTAIPYSGELARDTQTDALRVANDPALRDIEDKPPELLNRAIAALESANTPLARSRAEAIRQELRRREQEALDAREAEQIREDDETLAAAPVEVEEVWQAAKVADTPEKQAAVMAMIPRARTTIASLEDLIGSGREERLMAQAQSLFPHAPRKSEAEIAAELAYKNAQAEAAHERAQFLAGIRDPKIRAATAAAMLGEERAETEEATRNEKEEKLRADADRARAGTGQARAKADEIRQLVDDREKLLQEQAKTQEALRQKWADAMALARAKVRAGRGGGSPGAAGKAVRDALKQATALREANEKLLDRNVKEIADVSSAAKQAEAEIQAHSRIAEPGKEPDKPTSADPAAQVGYMREKAAYDKRVAERANAQAQIAALEESKKALAAQKEKLTMDVDSARKQNREELEPLIKAGIGGLAKSLGVPSPATSPPVPATRPTAPVPTSRSTPKTAAEKALP